MSSNIIWGINDSSHDASLSVISDSEIVFASHSERYNKIKNTFSLCDDLIEDALLFGEPTQIAYFEKRKWKTIRKLIHGGNNGAYEYLYRSKFSCLKNVSEKQFSHHYSHAAAGYFTSGFSDAAIVVIDAIGEFETATIWNASGTTIKKVFSLRYPVSFGLFYSAFTHLVGLEPAKEEYILMGMSAFGDNRRYARRIDNYFPSFHYQSHNMHRGVPNWDEELDEQSRCDIAAATQFVYERRLLEFMRFAKTIISSKNLVFMGGCALNCKANSLLLNDWDKIWIMPNPGDSGSSLGAALALNGGHVNWNGPYLGKAISNNYPIEEITEELNNVGIVGVASGRAEFGPRAFGNRSILADPRKAINKNIVNEIKKREKFRPFAPVVMEEFAHEWFDMPYSSPYMQYAVKCKKPHLIPAVVHIDGTSRVQTVNKQQHSGLYKVLQRWNSITGIPILLNTSLNIKNQPLLNDICDVELWRKDNPEVRLVV
jgi:carbamoyltransferase